MMMDAYIARGKLQISSTMHSGIGPLRTKGVTRAVSQVSHSLRDTKPASVGIILGDLPLLGTV